MGCSITCSASLCLAKSSTPNEGMITTPKWGVGDDGAFDPGQVSWPIIRTAWPTVMFGRYACEMPNPMRGNTAASG